MQDRLASFHVVPSRTEERPAPQQLRVKLGEDRKASVIAEVLPL